MRWWMLFGLLAFGCGKQATPEPNGEGSGARVDVPAQVDVATGEIAAGETPEALYAACRDRVEQPEADGECTTDQDCAPAGCSGEICTTKAAGAEVMSTCEIRACYAVLDTCGCVEGRCAWSLVASLPDAAPKGMLK